MYVDDILITCDDPQLVQDTKSTLQRRFKIKELGKLQFFLGIEVSKSKEGTLMHQRKYILDLIADTGLSGSKPVAFLSKTNQKLTTIEFDAHVGILQTRSSTEAEYISLVSTVTKVIWLLGLFRELDVASHTSVPIYCDSKSSIQIAANHVLHELIKHIDIDCHFIREEIKQELVKTIYLSSTEQHAYVLTKGLGRVQHDYLVSKLGMKNIFIPPNLGEGEV
uniref:Uncharacterized mitochondrial protein AtMg00810-like n=1 Tax=Nicotiana tabacum TaxID=4097 RepID=A0A1S4BVF0_TOBAC|nr:PREDICTED: uncharacterized mitochondrial protein AtMg00810-like [Nicotiana tabacum]